MSHVTLFSSDTKKNLAQNAVFLIFDEYISYFYKIIFLNMIFENMIIEKLGCLQMPMKRVKFAFTNPVNR